MPRGPRRIDSESDRLIFKALQEGQALKTYRLALVGSTDGIIYGIKEYEAESDARAAELARQLCGQHPDDLWWDGQRLTTDLRPMWGQPTGFQSSAGI